MVTGAKNSSRDGLFERIRQLLGPPPVVRQLPELLQLTIKPQARVENPTVEAKMWGRELAMMKVEFPGGKLESYVVMQQGSTNYSVVYSEKDGEKYFLFVEQYRPTLAREIGDAKIFADFPGGYNSDSVEQQTVLQEALRELGEETNVAVDDLADVKADTNYLDGIYTIRKTVPENSIVFGRYLKDFDLEPRLFGSEAEGERTVAVWYSEAEVREMLRNGRFGTPGVVAYALMLLS